MRFLTRARAKARRLPREHRAAEFDRAVSEFFMRIALEEAARGVGRTAPNPCVGAILVKGGRVIARGWHRKAGTAHAEVVALEAAGQRARGADLYSTLEPCDHWGRTPPCTQAIIEAGVRRVFFASTDPNPLVNGKGARRLARAGIVVKGGILKSEADALNRPFFKLMREGVPYVTLKAAVTLDGKIATSTGDSRWVSGGASRERAHRLRDQVDAILVGANTVVRDDPQLTTRLPHGAGRDAMRVVIDSRLRAPPSAKIFNLRSPAKTVVATLASPESKRARALERLGVEVWQLPAKAGRVDLKALLRRLGRAGCLHIMVEGGAEIFGSFLKQQLADELWLFVAPKIVGASGLSFSSDLGIGRMARAMVLSDTHIERVGDDFLIRSALRKG